MSKPTPELILAFVKAMAGASWAMVMMIQKMDKEFGPMRGTKIFFDQEPRYIRCQWDAEGFGIITVQFGFKLDLQPFSMGLFVPEMSDATHVRLLPEPLRKANEFIQEINLATGGGGVPQVRPLDRGGADK